jgi:hypothetical protein
MTQVTIVTKNALMDSILDPYRTALGPSLYMGYRNHAYGMLNFGQALAPAELDRNERLAVMAAFHDLPFCLDGDLDYLDRAADLTEPLAERARPRRLAERDPAHDRAPPNLSWWRWLKFRNSAHTLVSFLC